VPLFGGAVFLSNTMTPGPRPTSLPSKSTSVPSGILIHPIPVIWPQETYAENCGLCPPLFVGRWVPILHKVAWAETYLHTKWHLSPSSHSATTDMARKLGGCAHFIGGWGAGSQSNTMWSGPRPTCMPSFILIRPTVWPQYTNVTDRQTDRQPDRQDRQRSDSIGRTGLQTVAQKRNTVHALCMCMS